MFFCPLNLHIGKFPRELFLDATKMYAAIFVIVGGFNLHNAQKRFVKLITVHLNNGMSHTHKF